MLTNILAISGQSGLFKLVSNTKNGIIVENIETKKRIPSYATNKVSSLKDISIYTDDNKDIPLEDLMITIKEKTNNQQAISHKATKDELQEFFLEVMPNYDNERVYISDIKKVIQWYNILQKENLINEPDKENKETNTDKEK